jgi:predicted AAA+ superfamily ATPase
MDRSLQVDLYKWYHKKDRKPLILRGARQVGKSTLVKLFAAKNNLDLITINFEKMKLLSIDNSIFKIEDVISECQVLSQKEIKPNTLIFFDEIQEQPKLIQFLRYFYEEAPELAVVSAGSLLELRLKQEEISFPIGRVEFMFMGPMTFSEFLIANNQSLLLEEIQKINPDTKNKKNIHILALEQLKKYFFVGGMPKAVAAYTKNKDPIEVREIQDEIILAYKNDFPKYNRRIDVERISRVFIKSAHHIGQKIKYQELDENSNSRDIRRIVELLIDAHILTPCYHSNGTHFPLASQIDFRIYKPYFLDIGLLNAIQQLAWHNLIEEFDRSFHKKGEIAEQFVAQHLCFYKGSKKDPELFYWLNDKNNQKGEIDFLIENNQTVFPVEIKSSANGTLKSLFYFSYLTKWKKGIRLSTQEPSIADISHLIDGKNVVVNLTNIPLYQIEFLSQLELFSAASGNKP